MNRAGAALCLVSALTAALTANTEAQARPPSTKTTETDLEPSGEANREPSAFDERPLAPQSKQSPRLERRISDLVWAEAEGGIARVGLDTLSTGEILAAEVLEAADSTFVWGVGVGLRALVVTVGVRFRYADFERWNLATTNIEAGFRIPIRSIEPSFTFGAGHATLGNFDFEGAGELERAGVDVSGVNLRAGVGVDVYLPHQLYVGTKFTGDLLLFVRPAVSPKYFSNAIEATAANIYAQDGSSIGSGTALTCVVGVHLF
jgi:hypothetical protein